MTKLPETKARLPLNAATYELVLTNEPLILLTLPESAARLEIVVAT